MYYECLVLVPFLGPVYISIIVQRPKKRPCHVFKRLPIAWARSSSTSRIAAVRVGRCCARSSLRVFKLLSFAHPFYHRQPAVSDRCSRRQFLFFSFEVPKRLEVQEGVSLYLVSCFSQSGSSLPVYKYQYFKSFFLAESAKPAVLFKISARVLFQGLPANPHIAEGAENTNFKG